MTGLKLIGCSLAALVVVGVMGVGMYQAFVIIERRMTFWAIRTQEVVT